MNLWNAMTGFYFVKKKKNVLLQGKNIGGKELLLKKSTWGEVEIVFAPMMLSQPLFAWLQSSVFT